MGGYIVPSLFKVGGPAFMYESNVDFLSVSSVDLSSVLDDATAIKMLPSLTFTKATTRLLVTICTTKDQVT